MGFRKNLNQEPQYRKGFMKEIITGFLITVFAFGCTNNADKSVGQDSLKKLLIIEVYPYISSARFNAKEVEDVFFNILNKNGTIKLLSFKDSSETLIKNDYSDIKIGISPIYEGPPCKFQKELSVVKIDFIFYGTDPYVTNGVYNRWDEERFVQLTDNEQGNTEKIKTALSEVAEGFFAWIKQSNQRELVFYVDQNQWSSP